MCRSLTKSQNGEVGDELPYVLRHIGAVRSRPTEHYGGCHPQSKSRHINCEAKVDTGASLCIFARDLGEQLGLEVESGMRQLVGTVTGTFVVYLHEVNLSVAGLECSAFVGFAEDEGFRRN